MTNEYVTSNRGLWNEWTAIHEKSEFYDLESFKAGGIRLRDFEIKEVGGVCVGARFAVSDVIFAQGPLTLDRLIGESKPIGSPTGSLQKPNV